MIEFKGKVIENYPYHALDVYIDNQLVPEISATQAYKKPKYDLSIRSERMEEQIFSYPIDYFIPNVNKLVFSGCFSLLEDKYFESNVEIDIDENINVESTVSIDIMPNVSDWNLNFSINEYIESFFSVWEEIQKRIQPFDIFDWSLDKHAEDYQISISNDFHMYFSSETLKQILSPLFALVKECHETTLNILESNTNHPEIISEFKFPEELKVSCEQYLLYFARFLQDLGINATSNLKEEVGRVLFSVTPTDDVEALDKIREALTVYLNLPSSPVLYNDSFQSMQLKQQVENLQHSQRMKEMEMRSAQYALRLAQQNIDNQDKIITQQNSFIDNQNKIIEKVTSKSIMIDSLENKEELEKFCEGFEVGKSEFLIKHFGLHLNPATVLKSAGKKILGKEESKSILGLNEEMYQEDN